MTFRLLQRRASVYAAIIAALVSAAVLAQPAVSLPNRPGSLKFARDLGRPKSRATTTELVPR